MRRAPWSRTCWEPGCARFLVCHLLPRAMFVGTMCWKLRAISRNWNGGRSFDCLVHYQLQKKPLPKRCGPRTASSRSLPCSLALFKVTHDDKRPFSFHMSNEFKPCWDFSRATEETITDLNMEVGTQCANKQLNNEPGQTWQELQDIYLAALAVSTF